MRRGAPFFLQNGFSCEVIRAAFPFLLLQLSLLEVLSGAVDLAEVGFPVAEVTVHHWANWVAALRNAGKEVDGNLLIVAHPPKSGQLYKNPALAQTLKVVSYLWSLSFRQTGNPSE